MVSTRGCLSQADATRDIARPLQALTSRDSRTGAMAKKFLLPWNWFRGALVIDAMIDKLEEGFGKGTLNFLPGHRDSCSAAPTWPLEQGGRAKGVSADERKQILESASVGAVL